MVIKNKEERSYSLWRFVGVAAIPMLLLFFAGFSLGDTAGTEKDANRKALDAAQRQIDSLQAELQIRDSFFRRGDELLGQVADKVSEYDKELLGLADQIVENELLVSDWQSRVNKYFRFVSRDLDNLEIDFTEKNKKLEPTLDIGLRYFKEHLLLHRNRLFVQENTTVGKAKEGKLDDLSQLEDKLTKQEEDFKKEAAAQKKDLEIEKLQTRLDRCQEDLKRAQAAGVTSNGEYKANIISKVDAIRGLLPKFQKKWGDKGIIETRDQIKIYIDDIWQNANQIK